MSRASVKDLAGTAAVGLVFGAALALIGFTSWDEVHAMFAFASLRLTLTFALTVALLASVFWGLRFARGDRFPTRAIHRGTIPGGALFGLGWSLCGACPSIALVQIGEGQLGALATLAGIVAGSWAYAITQERWLRWPTPSCNDA